MTFHVKYTLIIIMLNLASVVHLNMMGMTINSLKSGGQIHSEDIHMDPNSSHFDVSFRQIIAGDIFVADKDSEIMIKSLSVKNITYFFNLTSPGPLRSKILVQFHSSNPDILYDIEAVLNANNYRSMLTISLNPMESGRTKFYITSLHLIQEKVNQTRNETDKIDESHKDAITMDNTTLDITNTVVNISVYSSVSLITLSTVIGWIYFFAWSLSFYPQIYENWCHRSVVGLNFDFLVFNTIGYLCYSAYNLEMYTSEIIKEEYRLREGTLLVPVKSNDLAFSLHGIFACLITAFQCMVYNRGNQKISKICLIITSAIMIYVVAIGVCKILSMFLWLDFLTYLSYIKILITIIKYIPQAYMNYQRKSTRGWSIWLVLLDLVGGIFSTSQMIIDGFNFNDWSSIIGNPTKFVISIITYIFDSIFILQHYVFYKNNYNIIICHNNYETISQQQPSQLGIMG